MRKTLPHIGYSLLTLIVLLIIIYLSGPRPLFETFNNAPLSDIPATAGVAEQIAAREASIGRLKPDNEARIVWADSVRQTPYAVVYLHGFSASHFEGRPIHERFAERYGCNLYLTRLAYHGIDNPDAFQNFEPARLIESAKAAIAVGKALGEKVILMSCSTGSTLGLYLAAADPAVHSLIMYAPNIDLLDEKSHLLNGPWGEALARVVFDGDYRQWSDNDTISAYWTTRYHLDGLHALRHLVTETMTEETFRAVSQPTFVSYYFQDEEHKDDAISIAAIHRMLDEIGTPAAMVREVPTATAGSHPIASSYWNPNWQEVEAATWSFAEEVLQLQPHTKK